MFAPFMYYQSRIIDDDLMHKKVHKKVKQIDKHKMSMVTFGLQTKLKKQIEIPFFELLKIANYFFIFIEIKIHGIYHKSYAPVV